MPHYKYYLLVTVLIIFCVAFSQRYYLKALVRQSSNGGSWQAFPLNPSGETQSSHQEYSRVLCYSPHTVKFQKHFAADSVELITNATNRALVEDRFKVCIINNMCINEEGVVWLFLPKDSSNNHDELASAHTDEQKVFNSHYFTSNYQHVSDMLQKTTLDGSTHFDWPQPVAIHHESYSHYTKSNYKNIVHIDNNKWLTYHSPIFWFVYYHVVVDGFFKVFNTLRQVDHIMNTLKRAISNNSFLSTITPTMNYSAIPSFLYRQEHSIYLRTQATSMWNNKIMKVMQEAFPLPQYSQTVGDVKGRVVCGRKAILGISYTHYRHIYFTAQEKQILKPTNEARLDWQQYVEFILHQYGFDEIEHKEIINMDVLNILLVKRVINRVITDLEELKKHLETGPFKDRLNVKIIVCSDYSSKKQIEFFRWAHVVVGTHGSDLADSMFSRRGSVVVEVDTPIHMEPYFLMNNQMLHIRHFLYRAEGMKQKDAPRTLNLQKFIPYFEMMVCYPNFVYAHGSVHTETSKFCDWVRANRNYSLENQIVALNETQNVFDVFDRDQNVTFVPGPMFNTNLVLVK